MPYDLHHPSESGHGKFAARAELHRKHYNRLSFPSFDAVTAPMLGDPDILAHFHGHNHRAPLVDQSHAMAEVPMRHVLGVADGLREHGSWEPESESQRIERYNRRIVRQRKLALLQQTDPLFARTMHMLEFMLRDMPLPAVRTALRAIEATPNGFVRHYTTARDMAEHVEHMHHRAEIKRQDALEALKRKVKSGKAQEGDLLKYLELSGFGDSI